jgi:hypothetical protein
MSHKNVYFLILQNANSMIVTDFFTCCSYLEKLSELHMLIKVAAQTKAHTVIYH